MQTVKNVQRLCTFFCANRPPFRYGQSAYRANHSAFRANRSAFRSDRSAFRANRSPFRPNRSNRSVRESFRAEATPLQTFRPFKPRPVTFTVRTSHIAMASEKGGRKLTNKIKSVILNLKKVGLSTVKIQQIIEKQYDLKTTRQSIRRFLVRYAKTGSISDIFISVNF